MCFRRFLPFSVENQAANLISYRRAERSLPSDDFFSSRFLRNKIRNKKGPHKVQSS